MTDKGFIKFAEQESREAETTDAAKLMKPLSELNGGESAVRWENCFMGIDHKGSEMFWSV